MDQNLQESLVALATGTALGFFLRARRLGQLHPVRSILGLLLPVASDHPWAVAERGASLAGRDP